MEVQAMSPVLDQAASKGRLTPEEARAYVEEQVREALDMSLEEFYERARAKTLPDHPAVPHLVLLTGAASPGC